MGDYDVTEGVCGLTFTTVLSPWCGAVITLRTIHDDRVTAQTRPQDEVSRFERSVRVSPVEATLPAVTRCVGGVRMADSSVYVMRASNWRGSGMTRRWLVPCRTRLVTADGRFRLPPAGGQSRGPSVWIVYSGESALSGGFWQQAYGQGSWAVSCTAVT